MSEKFANQRVATKLNGAILAAATTLVVSDASGLPDSGVFRIILGQGEQAEIVQVGAISGATLTGLIRGSEGTTARDWPNNSAVAHILTAASFDAGISDKVTAHETDTTAIHGIADTSVLETVSGSQVKVDTHNADTTGVHGISDTAVLETSTGAQTKVDTGVSVAEAYTDTHVNDTSVAHVASSVGFTPTGSISSTDVQAAVAEVASEGVALGTTPSTQSLGDSAAGGSASTASKNDHKHGLPALGTTPSTQAFGDGASGGSATTPSKNDHKHAMPATPVKTIKKTGSSALTGDVTLSEGTNISLTQSGNDIAITSVGGTDTAAIHNTIVDAKGDLIAGTANDTVTRLAASTNGYRLLSDSSQSVGLKWVRGPVILATDPPYNVPTDGTTDATSTLNTWLAALPPGSTGYLPDFGNAYIITDTLTWPSAARVTLKADGAIIRASSSWAQLGKQMLLVPDSTTSPHIQGLRFDGNSKANEAVRVNRSGTDIRIIGCEVYNLEQLATETQNTAAIWVGENNRGVLIQGNYIHDLTASVTGAARGIKLTRITSSPATPCTNVRVLGNYIDNLQPNTDSDGMFLGDTNWTAPMMCIVQGNTIRNVYKRGMKVQGTGISIEGNTIINDTTSAFHTGIDVQVSRVVVRSNYIICNNTGGWNNAALSAGITAQTNSDIQFIGNQCLMGDSADITLSDGVRLFGTLNRVNVSNNTFHRFRKGANVNCTGTAFVFNSNIFDACTSLPIDLQGVSSTYPALVSITGNIATNTPGPFVWNRGNVQTVAVVGNVSDDTAEIFSYDGYGYATWANIGGLTPDKATNVLKKQSQIAVLSKAGAITDSDFIVTPVNATLGVDETNNRLYVRVGGTWKYVEVN